MRVCFDLFQTADDMVRQRFRNRHPDADQTAEEEAVQAWLDGPPLELAGKVPTDRLPTVPPSKP